MNKLIKVYAVCKFSFSFFCFLMFTLKCLDIGAPKTINFPFVPNGKLFIFMCPNI